MRKVKRIKAVEGDTHEIKDAFLVAKDGEAGLVFLLPKDDDEVGCFTFAHKTTKRDVWEFSASDQFVNLRDRAETAAWTKLARVVRLRPKSEAQKIKIIASGPQACGKSHAIDRIVKLLEHDFSVTVREFDHDNNTETLHVVLRK